MLSLPTLLAARQHLKKLLDEARKEPYRAADALVYQIALDCVNHCIGETEKAKEQEKINQEIDAAIARVMASRWKPNGD